LLTKVDFNKDLTSVTAQTNMLADQLAQEFAALKASEELYAALETQKQMLVNIIAQIPASEFPVDVVEPVKPPKSEKTGRAYDAVNEAVPVAVEVKEKKRTVEVEMVSAAEFGAIPKYIVGRMQLDKLNELVGQLNIVIKDKHQILAMNHGALN
jgi:Spindle and kinetochore-associated protein 1